MLRFNQIPEVAIQVFEHRDFAVWLDLGWSHKNNAFGPVCRVITVEIIGVEEEGDSSSGLVADVRLLFRG